jgi:hypothetical protein
MSADSRCEETRGLVPELALGIADGEERARVLEHVAVCSDCRRDLERFSTIVDELVELAPTQEPPAGFELSVLDSLAPRPPRARRVVRRSLVLAAAALAASAVTAGALLLSFRDDRRLADHYRAALAEARGSYFGAVRLHDASGTEGGVVFVYRGSTSWLMITVAPRYRATVVRAEIGATNGRRIPLRWFRLQEGTWGGPLPSDPGAGSAVHLLGRDGHPVLAAELSRTR